MPGVDSVFITLLDEIGATYTIYYCRDYCRVREELEDAHTQADTDQTMRRVRESVEAIYKTLDSEIRGLTRLLPVQYEDSPGVTSCFVFRGSPAKQPSSAFVQLSELTATLNDRIQKLIITWLSGWRYLTHVPHVTAAAVIDPIQEQTIPREPAESLLWTALVKSFAVLAASVASFEVSLLSSIHSKKRHRGGCGLAAHRGCRSAKRGRVSAFQE